MKSEWTHLRLCSPTQIRCFRHCRHFRYHRLALHCSILRKKSTRILRHLMKNCYFLFSLELWQPALCAAFGAAFGAFGAGLEMPSNGFYLIDVSPLTEKKTKLLFFHMCSQYFFIVQKVKKKRTGSFSGLLPNHHHESVFILSCVDNFCDGCPMYGKFEPVLQSRCLRARWL